jgi:hypothetical protein
VSLPQITGAVHWTGVENEDTIAKKSATQGGHEPFMEAKDKEIKHKQKKKRYTSRDLLQPCCG